MTYSLQLRDDDTGIDITVPAPYECEVFYEDGTTETFTVDAQGNLVED